MRTPRAHTLLTAVVLTACAVGCKSGESEPQRSRVTPSPSTCPIDQVTLGTYDQERPLPPCADISTAACERACDEGDATACVEVAYAIEQDPASEPKAQRMYARACALGHHNACTNRAAFLYHNTSSSVGDHSCAARIFQATCESGEPFGCGMYSLAQFEGVGVTKDADAALVHAGRTCQQTEHFACTALGRIYESRGDTSKAIVAFSQACETGYRDSCADAERLGAPKQ
jgi:TPR repeat protein